MSYRPLPKECRLLRVFLGEFDRFEHQPLGRLLLDRARESGLAGCTLYRGIAGYGAGKILHNDLAIEAAGERPLVFEAVDTEERIAKFWSGQEAVLKHAGSLATEERVRVHHYSSKKRRAP